MFELHQGDCLEVMKQIPNASVDMVLCDLPYGTTYANWDSALPNQDLFLRYNQIIKNSSAVVLFAVQPFTTHLIHANINQFRYTWCWDKNVGANFANSSWQPLKVHEDIVVFSKNRPVYFPQKTIGIKNHKQGNSEFKSSDLLKISKRTDDDLSGLKHPKSILQYPKHSSQSKLHPTQKPVALLEYLIKTYTNPGDVVLDNTMGSGSTGVACANTGRRFIGIEKDEKYFQIAKKRVEEAYNNSIF